jgi:uncharacterized protein DUF6455
MDTSILNPIGAAWLAVAAALVWALVHGLRRILGDDAAPPFFDMLARQGIRLAKVEALAGIRETARAVRRCALCGKKEACRAELSRGASGGRPADCPNAEMMERAART